MFVFAPSATRWLPAVMVLAACGSASEPAPAPVETAATPWSASLAVSSTDEASPSSTRLEVSWSLPDQPVDHLQLTVDAGQGAPILTTDVPADQTTWTLDALRSATDYQVTLVACLDPSCAEYVSPDDHTSASGATAEEVWQIQGDGDSLTEAWPLVSDGNVKLHVVRLGPEAPADVAGRLQLYYGPMGQDFKGVSVASGDAPAVTDDVSSVASFTALTGAAGLISPPGAAPLVEQVATPQAVPVSDALGGNVRLYFEARGADGRTRILYIGSQDGWRGQDFHTGDATVCSLTGDYQPGGPCEPTVALGVEGDAIAPSPGLSDVRQFKIGYPTQDDWRWDGADGTFMWVTVGAVPGCSEVNRNSALAVYEAGAWAIAYDAETDCPLLFRDVQSPSPVHLGAARYKTYYGTPSDETGKPPGSNLPFLGPKRVLYADGALTGDPAVVDYGDFEPVDAARPVSFVWPSGAPLDAATEGYLDDFVFMMPTGDPSFQIMYGAATDGSTIPTPLMAVLINP